MACHHEPEYEDYRTASFTFCKHCGAEWTAAMQREWMEREGGETEYALRTALAKEESWDFYRHFSRADCKEFVERLDRTRDERNSFLAENEELRSMLAYQYAGTALYDDDGELQDGSATPFIDFKRDSPWEIRAAMYERMHRQRAAEQAAADKAKA